MPAAALTRAARSPVPARSSAASYTLPFLISPYHTAVLLAVAVMTFEFLVLAWVHRRFFGTGFIRSFSLITLGKAIIAIIGAALGAASWRHFARRSRP
jgi:hypothetical protein